LQRLSKLIIKNKSLSLKGRMKMNKRNANASKIIVTYFSIPETDNPNNMTQNEANSVHVVNGEVFGNTQYVALLIQKELNANIYRIETKIDYPLDHTTLVNLGKVEKNNDVRPELKNKIEDFEEYDVIFIGYPNWYADFPMPIYTFLEEYDFSYKKIIPFVTHGGSGLSNTVQTIERKQPKAKVEKNAFAIYRDDMDKAPSMVNEWLNKLKLK